MIGTRKSINLLFGRTKYSADNISKCYRKHFSISSLSYENDARLTKTNSAVQNIRTRRCRLFEEEKCRQLKSNASKLEKIKVELTDHSGLDPILLLMNRNVSTPADCAKHLSNINCEMAALAQLSGIPMNNDNDHQLENLPTTYSDMHQPLADQCRIKLLTFDNPAEDVSLAVNQAFWRSCSFILGALIETSFNEQHHVTLHSWPTVDFKFGSFVYDVEIKNTDDWQPTAAEIKILTKRVRKNWIGNRMRFEPLVVSKESAESIFADNPFKLEHIRNTATIHGDVRLYRLGDHVDISRGPLISHSSQIGNYAVTRVYRLRDREQMYRFQGVALPTDQRVTSFTWQTLKRASSRMNLTGSITRPIIKEIHPQDIQQQSVKEIASNVTTL